MKYALLLLALAAATPHTQAQVRLDPVFSGLVRPVDLQADEEGRLYIAEQRGLIGTFEVGAGGDLTLARLFLNIADRVGEADLEGGLLSFAFHPDYAATGFVFVHYYATGPRRSVIARFARDPGDPLTAEPASEVILLEVEQPLFNHNGGGLSFGPDGLLYIALGDGGCCGDVFGNAQDPTTLLGSVLRLDVDAPDAGLSYGIPEGNPFADTGGPERGEIYAWGVRSPWRMSHDPATGDLWLGDVGEARREEVNRIEVGGNYGWPVLEGTLCFEPMEGCSTEGLALPVWEYGREDGRSVTGGRVYRGSEVPSLVGAYVYGDYVTGRLWALEIDAATGDTTNTELLDTDLLISSFGVDEDGELYVLNYIGPDGEGEVYRVRSAPVASEPSGAPDRALQLRLAGPNPFAGATALTVETSRAGPVRVAVYDVLGREVAVLADGPGPAGARTLRLDARGLAAGVYVVRLEAAGQVETQRVTLVE